MANQFVFEEIYDGGGGGTGGSTEIELDTTLTQEGKAADAKAVGGALTVLETSLKQYIETTILNGAW